MKEDTLTARITHAVQFADEFGRIYNYIPVPCLTALEHIDRHEIHVTRLSLRSNPTAKLTQIRLSWHEKWIEAHLAVFYREVQRTIADNASPESV